MPKWTGKSLISLCLEYLICLLLIFSYQYIFIYTIKCFFLRMIFLTDKWKINPFNWLKQELEIFDKNADSIPVSHLTPVKPGWHSQLLTSSVQFPLTHWHSFMSVKEIEIILFFIIYCHNGQIYVFVNYVLTYFAGIFFSLSKK